MENSHRKYKNDVTSINHIIHALYDVISGEKGNKRDWDREKYIFHPNAQLTKIEYDKDGNRIIRFMTLEDFIEYAKPFLDGEGFFEYEIFNKVDEFAHIAHVWSTYACKKDLDDPVPYSRGINSIQLLNDQNRWWILSVYWNSESNKYSIPAKYL